MNTTNGIVGGTVDKASFLAIRPGHEVKLNVAGEMQSTIEVQMLALPFTQDTTLQETFAASLQDGFNAVFRTKYILNVKIEQSTVTLAIADLNPRLSPRLVVPVTDFAREIRFAVDAEQNFIVYINDELIMQHRIDAGLIEMTDDHVVLVFNAHSVGLEIPPAPSTVAYEVTAQPLLMDHDYVTSPADVYHYGQVESLTRDDEYILAPNQYYVADQVTAQHSSIVAPFDGTVQRIRISGNGIVSAVSAFANIGVLRMNANIIASTNIFTLAKVEGQTAALISGAEQGQGQEIYDAASVTLETTAIAGIFKAQWYTTSTAGLHYGYALEFPLSGFSGINEGLRWIWQLQSFDLLGGDSLSTSAIVEITSPAQYVPVTFSNTDGGDGGDGEVPDFSQDFLGVAGGATYNIDPSPTDLYFSKIDITALESEHGNLTMASYPRLVLNVNPNLTENCAVSYDIPTSAEVGCVFYFILPLNGQEQYSGAPSSIAGLDPAYLSALVEIQVYLYEGEKYIQIQHLAGAGYENEVLYGGVKLVDFGQLVAVIDQDLSTVQLFAGEPGTFSPISRVLFVNDLQRISFLLATANSRVIGRYGTVDSHLFDIPWLSLFNGQEQVDSLDEFRMMYVMNPSTALNNYDPNDGYISNNPMAMLHRVLPDIEASYPRLVAQGATGSFLGYYPDQPCVMTFAIGRIPNTADEYALSVPQVRSLSLELVIMYSANATIDSIRYRAVDPNGITYLQDDLLTGSHQPIQGYENGWAIGVSLTTADQGLTPTSAGIAIFNRYDGTMVTLNTLVTEGTTALGRVYPIENRPLFMSCTIRPLDVQNPQTVILREVYIPTGMPVQPL